MDDFNVPWQLSYNRNPSFTGRTRDLEHIQCFVEDLKQKKRTATPLVIHGTGGVGKTQLVREYIYAHATEFSTVIWIDAQNARTTEISFLKFMEKLVHFYAGKSMAKPPPYGRVARQLGLSRFIDDSGRLNVDPVDMGHIVQAAARWLKRDGNSDWLLIFDNVDNLESFRISDYFPHTACGNIVLTSRRPECGRLGEGWELQVMDVQESVDLLSKSYGRIILVEDEGTKRASFDFNSCSAQQNDINWDCRIC
jgi:hypothetical protein